MNFKFLALGFWMMVAVAPAFAQRPVNDGFRPVNDGYRPVSDGQRPINDGYRPVNEG